MVEDAQRGADRDVRHTLDRFPACIAVHRQGRFLYLNRAGQELLGYDPEELVGQSIYDLVAPEDRAQARRGQELLERRQTLGAVERRLRAKDGSVIPVEVMAFPIEFEGARAFASLVRDQRAQKAMERQLVFAERMASVGALAAGVAHEINNPLTYVLANTEALEYELEEAGEALGERLASLRELVAEIRHGAERVRATVRDLLVFSRDDEGEAPVDVRAVLESSISIASNQIKHRARLVTRVEPVAKVHGNERRLGQVFLNLLVNAAQALPEGKAHLHEIRVSLTEDGDTVVLRVEDTGPGIPPENLDRIFEPFFTTKPAGVGTGLGLALCYSIVRSYGGTIEVRNLEPHGAAFVVRFPSVRTPSTRPEGPRRASRPPVRVLVIDDDPLVLRVISRTLRGHRVDTTTDPREGLERLAGEAYDLVLCDLMMPGLNGMEVYRSACERDADWRERFLFVTGGALSPETRAFLQREARTILMKPFQREELAAVVDEAYTRLGPRSERPAAP